MQENLDEENIFLRFPQTYFLVVVGKNVTRIFYLKSINAEKCSFI